DPRFDELVPADGRAGKICESLFREGGQAGSVELPSDRPRSLPAWLRRKCRNKASDRAYPTKLTARHGSHTSASWPPVQSAPWQEAASRNLPAFESWSKAGMEPRIRGSARMNSDNACAHPRASR